jgi:hypothetical protein
MTTREKALAELKRQIKEQRARLDPKLLKMAEIAAKTVKMEDNSVPYDRESASKAVEMFLAGHADSKGFRQKLLEMIRKNQH